MRIRAAVLRTSPVLPPYADTLPLSIEELELGPPQRGEILIRLRSAGLCHSDLSVINGDRSRPTPMVLGHEASGEVVAVGADVHDLVPGDQVVTVFVPSCGCCAPCAEGKPALCVPASEANNSGQMLTGGYRLSRGDEPIHHHIGVSAFAEYAVVSRRSLVKIARDLPPEVAALFGCAVLTGVGAVVNTASVRVGQSVAIVGLGGVGLSAMLGAIASGAARVIAIDISQHKLDLATRLGATDVFLAGADGLVGEILEVTKGGVDHGFDMAGSVKALETAYQITRRGGTTTTAGLAHPSSTMALSPTRLVAEERTIKGSYLGSCIPGRDIPRFVDLYRQGRLPVEKLWTSSSSLDEINEGFDKLHTGETIRHIIRF